MAANHAVRHVETWGQYAGRKLGHVTKAAALVKGAVDAGRAVYGAAQFAAPYLLKMAPMLL